MVLEERMAMKKLIERKERLWKKLGLYRDIVRGSINSICAKCQRSHCICDKKTTRKAYRLTYKDCHQKTKIVYVPENRLPEIKKRLTHYSTLRRVINQLIDTNIRIFKKGN
jgi:hypothetical protein